MASRRARPRPHDPQRDARRPAARPPGGRAAATRRLRTLCGRLLAAWRRSGWAPRLTRMGTVAGRGGYLAKGALYLVMGALAADAALQPYDPLRGAWGALRFVQEQPLGRVLVGTLGAGLGAYTFWLLVQALLDPLHRGRGRHGVLFRGACLVTAALYGMLARQAAELAVETEIEQPDTGGATALMRGLLAQPEGRWALVAIGVVVLGYGLAQVYGALRGTAAQLLDLSKLSEGTRKHIVRLGSAGIAARGIATGVIGWLAIGAAWRLHPHDLLGMSGALRAVRDQPHGPLLLVVLAAGLAVYGLLQWARAFYWENPR